MLDSKDWPVFIDFRTKNERMMENKIEYKNGTLIKGDVHVELKSIKDKSVDLFFSDFPFGTTKCKWDTPLDLSIIWKEVNRIIKDRGAILLFAQTPFDKVLGASNLKMLKYEWIWEKTQATGHLNSKKMPMKAHENILVFYKKLPTYNPQKTSGHVRKVSSAENRSACIERRNQKDDYLYNKEYSEKVSGYDSTERYPRSVIKFKTDKQTLALHPTQKPISLCEYLIKTYTNEGDLVVDGTTGSGSIPLAADNTNRKFIAIEKEDEWFKESKKRLDKK